MVYWLAMRGIQKSEIRRGISASDPSTYIKHALTLKLYRRAGHEWLQNLFPEWNEKESARSWSSKRAHRSLSYHIPGRICVLLFRNLLSFYQFVACILKQYSQIVQHVHFKHFNRKHLSYNLYAFTPSPNLQINLKGTWITRLESSGLSNKEEASQETQRGKNASSIPKRVRS